jgi:hypothetical protein
MSVEPLEISHETIGRNLQKTGEKAAAVPLTKGGRGLCVQMNRRIFR